MTSSRLASLPRSPGAAAAALLPRLLCLLALSACGCAAVAIGAKMAGPPPVKAQYIPLKRPTVVYVQGIADPSGANAGEDESIALLIEEELRNRDIVPIVPSVKVYELRSRLPAEFPAMNCAAIGQEVSAEQVIHVRLEGSSVDVVPGGNVFKGQMQGTIRVVDVETGRTLWPSDTMDDGGGARVAVQTPMLSGEAADATAVRRGLYESLADRVAKLFYTYKPDE